MVTPHLDALADEGVLFQNHHVQIAVCVPSRIALMTGVRPDTTRQLYGPHVFRENRPGIVTMQEHFEANGYYTMSLGKIYHFVETKGFSEEPWHPSWDSLYALPPYRGRTYWTNGEHRSSFPPVEMADRPESMYMDGQTADKALEALGRLAGMDRPFWLGVGFFKPHLPLVAPKAYWDLYDRNALPLPERADAPEGMPAYAFNEWADLNGFKGIEEDRFDITEAQARELIHGYYACVSFVDAQIGRVLDKLEDLGLRENTIVVLWGDHGWHLGDQGMWSKSTNFERATRAPLIVADPRAKSHGRPTAALVETVDIFPSLCELSGLPVPEGIEGTSFTPLLENPGADWKTAVFSQYNREDESGNLVMGYSIRTRTHRYTEWVRGWQGREVLARELYAYDGERDERVNLAGNPDSVELLETLRTRLHAGWQAEALKGTAD
jgi:iduronate 2-sulfatase